MDLRRGFSLIMLMIFVIEGNYVAEGQEKIIIYKCDIISCTNNCLKAYGTKLKDARCNPTKFGNICTCYGYPPINHKVSRKSLLDDRGLY